MTPTKLRDDAIVEALCQLNFSAPSQMPEVVLGRLSDFGGGYVSNRLPFADIPPTVRRVDPNLKYQPLLELRKNASVIRVGENVLSAHVTGAGQYPGWNQFLPQLKGVFGELFKKVSDVKVEGITLRYINAMVEKRHYMADAHELRLQIAVAGTPFRGPVNLNFIEPHGEAFLVTTRIAHPKFVQGALPLGTAVIVDVEVTSTPSHAAGGAEAVWTWLEEAHALEKEAFFRLIPQEILSKLVEA